MRECLTCRTAKPDPCYQSAKSGICLACMGRFARKDKDRRRGEHLARLALQAEKDAYPDQSPGEFVDVPEQFFHEWCRDMQALLPTLWPKL